MTLRLNGSTSGYVEIDAPATAGSNTLVLPTGNGTNGQVLSTNGSGALSWVQGGRILQVVMGTTVTRATITSATFTNSNLSVTITPASASNSILLYVTESIYVEAAAGAGYMDIARGTTNLSGQSNGFVSCSSNTDKFFPAAIVYLDSPNTTSATTYTLRGRRSSASGSVLLGDNNKGVIIAMEVAA